MSELDEIKTRFQAVYNYMEGKLGQAHAEIAGLVSELAHVKALLAEKVKEVEKDGLPE